MSGKRPRPARSSKHSQPAEDLAPQRRNLGKIQQSRESTNSSLSGEAEPRRSVRATKGQHTKSFDELELTTAPKKRQTKKTKKAKEAEHQQEQEQEQGREQDQDREQEQDIEEEQEEEPEDEIIRCVCGATEQDEDSGEAWIACETCGAWQHNVCVGVSSFDDEIPEHYWCEQCRPDDHKELLAGMAKGEKPWEARRKAHEEEAEKKKKRGGRKGKGKRHSETKDELDKTKSKPSPAPDTAKDKKEPAAKPGKRKAREDSLDTDSKVGCFLWLLSYRPFQAVFQY